MQSVSGGLGDDSMGYSFFHLFAVYFFKLQWFFHLLVEICAKGLFHIRVAIWSTCFRIDFFISGFCKSFLFLQSRYGTYLILFQMDVRKISSLEHFRIIGFGGCRV